MQTETEKEKKRIGWWKTPNEPHNRKHSFAVGVQTVYCCRLFLAFGKI